MNKNSLRNFTATLNRTRKLTLRSFQIEIDEAGHLEPDGLQLRNGSSQDHRFEASREGKTGAGTGKTGRPEGGGNGGGKRERRRRRGIGVDLIKTFYPLLTVGLDKLECLSHGKFPSL
jgi:hypothetical protein